MTRVGEDQENLLTEMMKNMVKNGRKSSGGARAENTAKSPRRCRIGCQGHVNQRGLRGAVL